MPPSGGAWAADPQPDIVWTLPRWPSGLCICPLAMGTLDQLKNLIPSRVRRRVVFPVLNQVGAFLIDTGNRLLGQYDHSIPPTRMHFGPHGPPPACRCVRPTRRYAQHTRLRPWL